MDQDQFLQRIYQGMEVGMKVLIPKRQTDIVEIRGNGEIVYLIANTYRKILSREELVAVYDQLDRGELKTSMLRKIVTSSRTCNASTIRWLLKRFDLATEQANKSWVKTW